MKTVLSCPACGCLNSEVIAQLDQTRIDNFLRFDEIKFGGLLSGWIDSIPPEVLGCAECGHSWYRYQPEVDQLNQMYAVGRPLKEVASDVREPVSMMRDEMRSLYRLLNAGHSRLSLLDYGSGGGRWSRAAVMEGFFVTAYEPSIERGSENNAPFELVHNLAQLRGRKFDVIQLEQVLEHLPDPLGSLIELREFCHKKTLVRLTVPNLLRDPAGREVWNTWPFDGFRPHILAPFEHLHAFTPYSLESLIERAGYRSISSLKLLRHWPSVPLRRWFAKLSPRIGCTRQYIELTT